MESSAATLPRVHVGLGTRGHVAAEDFNREEGQSLCSIGPSPVVATHASRSCACQLSAAVHDGPDAAPSSTAQSRRLPFAWLVAYMYSNGGEQRRNAASTAAGVKTKVCVRRVDDLEKHDESRCAGIAHQRAGAGTGASTRRRPVQTHAHGVCGGRHVVVEAAAGQGQARSGSSSARPMRRQVWGMRMGALPAPQWLSILYNTVCPRNRAVR